MTLKESNTITVSSPPHTRHNLPAGPEKTVNNARIFLRRKHNCQKTLAGLAFSPVGNKKKPGGIGMLELRTLCFEDLETGMREELVKHVSSSDVVGFAEVSGDRNPIHLSEHFAARTPFKTRIAHGLYTASLISAVLGTRLPGPGAIYLSQTLNFKAPVRIGDDVKVTVTVEELMERGNRARLSCICSVEDQVVLEGEALVKVPRRDEDRSRI
ncbi:(R)-specific enoyl-CoA hydratase [Roseibium album]|uniref:(R)-specific enoyl-CoA hydratase n=2 Tax=Hyphomicrobiales TaxID=356 RepID=A0A0M7ABU4_9HYPH|nr:(R)-specific enoyl-CoA hydratase [Roseibium album]CTQ64185.1 (R)-specific enoyl-CoA hydratase [Roseibium album]CTQ72605.1 (R)-specific enoyl-CoA hydratase [Roseibium album]